MHKTSAIKKIFITLFLFAFFLTPATASEKPEIFVQTGHSENINSIAYSPDGRYIISGSEDKTVKLWEVSTGKEVKTFEADNAVRSVAFSPDGRHIAAGGTGGMRVWDVWTGKEILKLKEYYSVAFSPDGQYIAGGGYGAVTIWDVSSGSEIKTFTDNPKYEHWFDSVSFSPDNKYILIGTWKYIKLWEIATGKQILTFNVSEVNSISFSPDGKYFTCATGVNKINLWSVQTGEIIKTFGGNESEIRFVMFSPDGKFILSNGASFELRGRYYGGGFKLWDVDNGTVAKH